MIGKVGVVVIIAGQVLTYNYIKLNFLYFLKYKLDLFIFITQTGLIYRVRLKFLWILHVSMN